MLLLLLLYFPRVSVSRAIRPFGNPGRPDDWFSQKVCITVFIIFMPFLIICCKRHCVCELLWESAYMITYVIIYWHFVSMISYLVNFLGEFHQIYNLGAVGNKDALIRYWGQEVKCPCLGNKHFGRLFSCVSGMHGRILMKLIKVTH